jgi:uncharacterized protein (TIGR03437 family)
MQLYSLRRLTSLIAACAFCLLGALAFVTASGGRAVSSQTRADSARDPRSARLRELDARLSDPGMLLLRAAEFDPRRGEPTPLRLGARQLEMTRLAPAAPSTSQLEAANAQSATTERAYFIVQFADVIQPEQTASLGARGYEIVAYVPNNAYLVRAPRVRQSALQLAEAAGEFRWVGAYGAGLKVEPELVEMANGAGNGATSEAAGRVTVGFTTFRGESAQGAREAVARLGLAGASQIIERFDSRASGTVEVPAAQLSAVVAALAAVEGIEWIERQELPKTENDNGIKIIQSGGTGANSTPLYARGLTGAGQVIGVADSGLDTDHAQFRLDSSASSQTLSFATTTQDLVNGALKVNVTNPNNKVLAYYVLGTGALIDRAANPNGGKILDPDSTSNAVAYDDTSGSFHGTHVTSVAAGRDYAADGSGAVAGLATRTSGDGVAPDARIVLQDVGRPGGSLAGLNVGTALMHLQAYNTGARVHNNSYGGSANSSYNSAARDTDDMMWRLRDYTIFFSAGNSGPAASTMTKDSKSALLVGGAETPTNGGNFENVAAGSSHGPMRDGRIKPDLVTVYTVRAATETAIVSNASTTAQDAGVNAADPNNNRSFSVINGTSFASPTATGAGALVRQYYMDGFYPTGARVAASGFNPSNMLVKATMINSGRNMTGTRTADDGTTSARAPLPSNGQGWGRLTLDDALFFAGDRRELKVIADIFNGATAPDGTRPAPNAAIQTGQTHTYQLTNVSTVEPLRLTLAWADVGGTPGAAVALVNNLDLEVVDPNGTVYRGNVNFSAAFTGAAGGAAFDNKNPVECVYVQYPVPGTYTVKVIGANVPGNGQTGVVAQPGNQPIDSNRQGYALMATGNFTAGAQPIAALGVTSVAGGVNADRFVGRNETVTAAVTVNNATVVPATNVNVRVAVSAASQIPAGLVRLNGQAAGQPATINFGDIAALGSKTLGFQVTLVDDGVNRAGQTITFDVTMTPANGVESATQFTITAAQRVLTYRTRWEPTADPGGDNIIVVPEGDWALRPNTGTANLPPAGDPFADNWQLTTSVKSANNGSTASLGDPSGVGASYGVSTTVRTDPQTGQTLGTYDDTRWWTKKIVLPGLTVDGTNRVSNPAATAQIAAAVESFEVDVSADFAGDTNVASLGGDAAVLRVRTYNNTADVTSTTDTGFTNATFINLLQLESSTPSTNGFRRFTGSAGSFPQNASGTFGVDTVTPNNSDVAFRFELQLRRNGNPQTGDGVYFDNLAVRFRVGDTTVFAAPTSNTSTSVDTASYLPSVGVAPGQILSAFGSGFPVGTTITAPATSTPLPTQLGGVSVRVNGVLAPLYYVGVGGSIPPGGFQINYQLPYETLPGVAYVEVLNNGALVTSEFLNVSANAPGIFTVSSNGLGQAVALNQDNSLNGVASQQFPDAKAEARGRVLQIFANGTGGGFVDFTTRQTLAIATGAVAPASGSPLYATPYTPTVTIGGVPATVQFSGLTPGFVGLWQLNVAIPLSAPTGSSVPLVISVNGRASNATTVAVN